MRETSPADFAHIYGGECVSQLEGAIFGGEYKAALADGRIGSVPLNRSKPVTTVWDLGYGDPTAIWFLQAYDGYWNFIDYLESTDETTADYVIKLQNKGYMYDVDWIPHDGIDTIIHGRLNGTGDRTKSIEMLLREARRNVRIVPKLLVTDQINAARLFWNQCRFDAVKCADGLQALAHYQWDTREAKAPDLDPRAGRDNDKVRKGKEPLHNWACFHLDTKVLTKHGVCAIINLPSCGEEILTPCGWKPYQGPRITQRNAQLVAVTFSDGTTVKCTPEHLFWTENGWRSASDLRKDSVIRSALTPLRSISMAGYGFFGHLRRNTSLGSTRSVSMWKCGSALLGQFRRAATFIMTMRTDTIIGWKTCYASQQPNMLHSFISDNSTLRTGRNYWKVRGGMPWRAIFGSAGSDVGLESGKNGNTLISRAFNAGKSFLRWIGHRGAVTSTVPRYAAGLRVESVSPLLERSDVCCIHVEDGGWFALANGAVVSNSHASSAFMGASIAVKQPKRAVEAVRVPLAPPKLPGNYSPYG